MSTTRIPHAQARALLLQAAVAELSSRGAVALQPQILCAELGVSKPLVNYHFGGRDGLIAEAMLIAYEDYVIRQADAVEAAPADPKSRLFAWVDAQIDWTRDHPGLAAALNFPNYAALSSGALPEAVMQRMREVGASNQLLVRSLVNDVRNELGVEPRDEFSDFVAATMAAWLTLGVSVWRAGLHVGTTGPADVALFDRERHQLRKYLLALISV